MLQYQITKLVPGQTVILNKRARKRNVKAKVFCVNAPKSDGGYAAVRAVIGEGYTSVTDKKYHHATVIVIVKDTPGGKDSYIRPLNSNLSLTADEGAQTSLDLDSAKPKEAPYRHTCDNSPATTTDPLTPLGVPAQPQAFPKPEKPTVDGNKIFLNLSEADFRRNIQVFETAIHLMSVSRVEFEHAVNKVKAGMK